MREQTKLEVEITVKLKPHLNWKDICKKTFLDLGRRSMSGSRDGANSDGASSSGGCPVGALTKRKSPMASRMSPTTTFATPRLMPFLE